MKLMQYAKNTHTHIFKQMPGAACSVTLCCVQLLTGESSPLIDVQFITGHSSHTSATHFPSLMSSAYWVKCWGKVSAHFETTSKSLWGEVKLKEMTCRVSVIDPLLACWCMTVWDAQGDLNTRQERRRTWPFQTFLVHFTQGEIML